VGKVLDEILITILRRKGMRRHQSYNLRIEGSERDEQLGKARETIDGSSRLNFQSRATLPL
jgi:hypothetical protein